METLGIPNTFFGFAVKRPIFRLAIKPIVYRRNLGFRGYDPGQGGGARGRAQDRDRPYGQGGDRDWGEVVWISGLYVSTGVVEGLREKQKLGWGGEGV